MANIIKDSVRKHVKDLIAEGFKTKDNKEKPLRYDGKSTVDKCSSEHCQSKSKCSPKALCMEARG